MAAVVGGVIRPSAASLAKISPVVGVDEHCVHRKAHATPEGVAVDALRFSVGGRASSGAHGRRDALPASAS